MTKPTALYRPGQPVFFKVGGRQPSLPLDWRALPPKGQLGRLARPPQGRTGTIAAAAGRASEEER